MVNLDWNQERCPGYNRTSWMNKSENPVSFSILLIKATRRKALIDQDCRFTQWTWVWASSRSWRWTGKPGVLQSMGSQRVRPDWVTELSIYSSLRNIFSLITCTSCGSLLHCYCLVTKSCPALCSSMDCGPPGSSVTRISQARILEWVAICFSRGSFSSQPFLLTHPPQSSLFLLTKI